MSENIEIGIHTEKSSKATLIRSIELMATQLSKFTFENKAALEKIVDIEKQTKNYRMNLDQLQQKLQRLDEQIARATPIIGRMKKDHDIYKEQYQEAKKQMLNYQLSVNNEETAIHDFQNKMVMQKKNIQSIINKIGKTNKNSKNIDSSVKSVRIREKKKEKDDSPASPMKTNHILDIQETACDKDCSLENTVKTKQSISTEYHYHKDV